MSMILGFLATPTGIVFLMLVIGILLVASPHFPDSEVSQTKNNDAFLGFTIVGAIFIVCWMVFHLMKKS